MSVTIPVYLFFIVLVFLLCISLFITSCSSAHRRLSHAFSYSRFFFFLGSFWVFTFSFGFYWLRILPFPLFLPSSLFILFFPLCYFFCGMLDVFVLPFFSLSQSRVCGFLVGDCQAPPPPPPLMTRLAPSSRPVPVSSQAFPLGLDISPPPSNALNLRTGPFFFHVLASLVAFRVGSALLCGYLVPCARSADFALSLFHV